MQPSQSSLVRAVAAWLFRRSLVAVGGVGLLVALASALPAQWMTVTGVIGTHESSYDESTGESVVAIDFTVKNTGSQAAYAMSGSSCGSYTLEWNGECPDTYWYNNGWLNPGQSTTATMHIAVNEYSPSNGLVTIVVAASTNGQYPYSTPYDYGRARFSTSNWAAVTFLPPPITEFRPSVTPRAVTETVPFATTLSRSFTVQNSGTRSAIYSLAASCGTLAGCAPSKTSTTLAPGATDDVSVSFTTPNTLAASNVVSLSATYLATNAEVIADTGSRPTVTQSIRPLVTPKNGAAVVTQDGWGVATFTLSAIGSGWFAGGEWFTPICEGWATSCVVTDVWSPDDDETISLVTVSFQSPPTPGNATSQAATVRLAVQFGVAADTGWMPAVLGYTKPLLTPRTTSVTEPAGNMHGAGFTITNSGNLTAAYSTTISCTVAVTCFLTGGTVFWLAPGASSTIGLEYVTPPIGQTGTIQVVATRSGNPAFVEADTAWVASTGADIFPPSITFDVGPAEGATIYGGSLGIAVTACDADGQIATPSATLNGTTVTATFDINPGCKSGTYALVARPGANTLVVSASDGVHTTSVVRHFTYDETWEATPVVTARVATELLRGGQQWADTFFVRNPAPVTIPYTLGVHCPASFTACTPSQPTINIAGGQTAKVWMTYTAATTGPVGYVGVFPSYTGTSGRTVVANDVFTQVWLDQAAPTAIITGLAPNATVDVFPDIGVQWCDADGTIVTHTVTIDGVPLADTFANEIQSGCTTAGSSSWSSVPVTLGSHTITATATDVVGHVTTSTQVFTFALPALTEFQPRVTPGTPSAFLIPDDQTIAFAVRNAGTRSAQYRLAPDCGASAIAGSCQVDKPLLTLAPGATDSAHVSFTIATLPSAAATVTLAATYLDLAGRAIADTGRVSGMIPTLAQLYQPRVSNAGSFYVAPSAPTQEIIATPFPVQNTGVARVIYRIDVTTTHGYGFQPGQTPQTSLALNAGETGYVMVQPLVPPGTRQSSDIVLTASYTSSDGTTLSSSGHAYIVPGVLTYGVAVTPKNQTMVSAQTSAVNNVDFIVASTGNAGVSVSATIACTGFVKNCRTPGSSLAASIDVTPWVVNVQFDVDTTVGRSGTVTFAVRGQGPSGAFGDSAAYTVVTSGKYVAVAVAPHAIRQAVRSNTDIVQHFDITNVGTDSSSFSYTATCGGAIGSCVASGSGLTVDLQPGQSASVTVSYHTGTGPGTTGSLTLRATSSWSSAVDSGVLTDSVAALPRIVVATQAVNASTTIARDQCLAIAAGDDAAYECGDLRIAHTLPATMTMGRTRAPMLVYNSGHARGHGIVAADVSVAQGESPTTLLATLTFGPGKFVQRSIAWNPSWSDGAPRRIAVPFDAASMTLTTGDQPIGVFKYTLEVRSPTDASLVNVDSGYVVAIDRSQSAFGQGWWLDGLEQLSVITPDTSQRLWVGGDGSARLYVPSSANVWTVLPTMDRPDTLEHVGSVYRRHLPNGAYVEFDAAGRQVATVNSLGHRTSFSYDAQTGRLSQIDLPVPSGSRAHHSYTLNYDGKGRLASVVAPAGPRGARRVVLAHPSSGATTSISSITDPGAPALKFGADASGLIVKRTNRLGDATRFGYDPASHLLIADTVDLRDGPPLVATFCPAEAASLAACAVTPVPTIVKTRYTGPRSNRGDTTSFFLTSYGAPRRIVNAIGGTTTIERADSHWPLLATAVVDPLGHRVEGVYDPARALLVSTTDVNLFATTPGGTSPSATTSYVWDATCDEVTAITNPAGETRTFAYDHPRCTRHSQKDGRGDSTAVTFAYDALNRLADIFYPNTTQGGSEHYDYDATLGNVRSTRSPKGVTTTVQRDVVGMDTLTTSPIDASGAAVMTRTVRDVLGRDSITMTAGPRGTIDVASQRPGYLPGSDSVVVRKWYNAEGRLDSLTRHMSPSPNGIRDLTTRWTYDAAGRTRSETAPDGQAEQYTFGDGVNMTSVLTRKSDLVTMRYDALNRLVAKSLPPTSSIDMLGTMSIQPQTDSFTYDPAGRMTGAINPNANIRRDYTIGGLLWRETQRLASATGALGQHDYVLQYTYDLAGRRRHSSYPNQLSAGTTNDGAGWVDYAYNAAGQLGTLTMTNARSFTYSYDARGRLVSVLAPNGVSDIRTYDEDDRVTAVVQRAPSAHLGWFPSDLVRESRDTIHADAITRDFLGRATHVTTYDRDDITLGYNGGGPLHYSRRDNPNFYDRRSEETYNVDPLGNVSSTLLSFNPAGDTHEYDSTTGRLRYIGPQDGLSSTTMLVGYDHSGNQQFVRRGRLVPTLQGPKTYLWTKTQNAYDASGHLRFVRTRQDSIASPSLQAADEDQYNDEETRYDALGRRVWVRSAHVDEGRFGCSVFCSVTRFVWDGTQVLGEVRMPVSSQENDVLPIFAWQPVLDSLGISHRGGDSAQTYSWRWGRTIYTHGPGIDQPVATTRAEGGYDTNLLDPFTMYSHVDWRGNVTAVSFQGGLPLLAGNSAATPPLPTAQNALLAAYRERGASTWTVGSWVGSLVNGQFGESGLEYRRNRYFDPQQERFTQEDPIGLGGGMNLYGFAGGDPVNFSDPLGLCPPCQIDNSDGLGAFRYAGAMLKPVQPILEAAGTAEMAMMPLGEAGAITKLGLKRTVDVVHFTSAEGAAAIEGTGALREGSFVALAGEVAGKSAGAVESFLEIGPGRGAMNARFRVPVDVLKAPFDGPTTSGGATQFQVTRAIPLKPGTFVPTP